MATTESKPKVKRMPIREFRASVKADMDLPLIVTSDGEDVFAVVRFNMLRNLLDKAKEQQVRMNATNNGRDAG